QGWLRAGWLSLCREGVEPSGSLQKVSEHPSSFSGLSLAQGKFHFEPPSPSHHSITSSAVASSVGGTAVAACAISAISFLVMALPKELKFSATATNAPAPPMTLLR